MATDGLNSPVDQVGMGQQPGPVNPSERIDAIDMLRGIALFGVLAINVVTEFRVSIFQQFLSHGEISPIDRAVQAFLMFAIDMKAFALFSLLFGVGLAIQFDRLAESRRRTQLLVRRLMALLAIGLLHLCLIWNGDILTEYALAGFIALPFLFGPRRLLGFGALLFLGLYLLMPVLLPPGVFPSSLSMWHDVAEANRIYPNGGFPEVLAFRLRELPLLLPLHIYVFPRTIGLFLLGAFTWRTGILQSPSTNNRLLLCVAAIGICLGAALTFMTSNGVIAAGRLNTSAGFLGTILLALGYGAAVITIASRERGKAWLGWAAPLGRMAFTNYLAQSLIFGWIFYGCGLGLFGRLGAASALAIGLVVYAGQVMFSRWWLNRYRYGPVEWLWRTLMYGMLQPMHLSPKRLTA
jgi:uncharacterized protein